jgi:rubrerythrin
MSARKKAFKACKHTAKYATSYRMTFNRLDTQTWVCGNCGKLGESKIKPSGKRPSKSNPLVDE